ncbi:ankyrin repeat domain-containing protein [Undibacterium sp. Ji83W]|uniref:ankyrin repeat domain-containing protein n=1 Tax=Undibacterium sp. Ji83W TaxID=3413043 RepID=UPI003BF1DBEC
MLGLFSRNSHAACSDTLLGDFASEKNGPAIIRIEKTQGELTYRMSTDSQQWDANVHKSALVAQDKLLQLLKEQSLPETSCAIWVDSGVLMKLPVGTAVQVSSPTQKSYIDREVTTGYVYYIMQGFMLEAIDLYPVAARGISPATPEPLKKRPDGKEVAGAAALCPGKKLPDMKQVAFNNLRASTKDWFRKRSPQMQLEFICGQWLHAEMLKFPGMVTKDEKERTATLENFRELLRAGQIPRDENGDAQWLNAGIALLRGNHDWNMVVALQKEFYDLFDQAVFPRLTVPAPYENSHTNTELLKLTRFMPAAQALRVLKKFNKKGFLSNSRERPETRGYALSPVAMELLQQYPDLGTVPATTLDFLFPQAGADAINDRELMRNAVATKNADAVLQLLKRGADPLRREVLSRAWDTPAYPSLLAAALAQHASTKAKTLLPQIEAEAVLSRILATRDYEKKIDWEEVDFLVGTGADINHMFGQNRPENIGVYAHMRPESTMQLIAHGLQLDKNHAYDDGKNKTSGELLPLYLRFEGYEPHREDLIRAMLTKYNNVNIASGCTTCGLNYPLDYALKSGRADLVKTFLEFGADPNNVNKDGSLSFWQAIIKNQPDMLEMMATSKFKLNLNAVDKNGISVLAWANCLKADAVAAWLSKNGALEIGREICAKVK